MLLISVDGMHSLDYVNCAKGVSGVNGGAPYCPNLAALGATGTNYLNASTSKPSDSFPGLMALVSGGSPRSVGAFYDVAYDRSLAPPKITTGNGVAAGPCGVSAVLPTGTTTEYEEGIDIDQTQLNGGAPTGDGGINSIDPDRLERDPKKNCAPVWPWNFVRTNTIFGVVHAAGGYTAWSDKHPAYSSVSGPGDGTNVDDYYSPEINSTVIRVAGHDPAGNGLQSDSRSLSNRRLHRQLPERSVLRHAQSQRHPQRDRWQDAQWSIGAPVPAVFGMNFQSVSVGQKLIESGFGSGGYLDAAGTPSNLLVGEIQLVDAAIGEFVSELQRQGLFEFDPDRNYRKTRSVADRPEPLLPDSRTQRNQRYVAGEPDCFLLPWSESPLNPNGIGPTEDDVSLLWLTSSNQTLECSVDPGSQCRAGGHRRNFLRALDHDHVQPVPDFRASLMHWSRRPAHSGHHRYPELRCGLYRQQQEAGRARRILA